MYGSFSAPEIQQTSSNTNTAGYDVMEGNGNPIKIVIGLGDDAELKLPLQWFVVRGVRSLSLFCDILGGQNRWTGSPSP